MVFPRGGRRRHIAKSISAYDMQVSDAIYGSCARYVCRERLEAMLEYEQRPNLERLAQRVATRRHSSPSPTRSPRATSSAPTNATAGWASRFRRGPGSASHSIVIHVRMLDPRESRPSKKRLVSSAST